MGSRARVCTAARTIQTKRAVRTIYILAHRIHCWGTRGGALMGRFDGSARLASCMLALGAAASLAAPSLTQVTKPLGGVALASRAPGRVSPTGQYQWPGNYFEARFKGRQIGFKTGPGEV